MVAGLLIVAAVAIFVSMPDKIAVAAAALVAGVGPERDSRIPLGEPLKSFCYDGFGHDAPSDWCVVASPGPSG